MTPQILSFDVKKAFIRDDFILKQFDKNRFKALRRYGAILRRNARKKLRRKATKKQKKSAAGEPPFTHASEPNLRTILYAMDGDDTLVTGPVGFNGTVADGVTVPEKLEYGEGDLEARPWMNPTLEENIDELGRSIEIFGVV